ncbi:MAG TPA: response regulator [Tepidisphaeraceae bacterium]|jgi:CheY-like chemotaxis protein
MADAVKAKSRQILLVEDDADGAQAMAGILRRLGHTVEIADSCRLALRIFLTRPFDLLLLDFSLPDGDGCSLLTELCTNKKVPAIAISGYGEEDMRRAESAGFSAYLLKPIDFKLLEDAINAAE